MKESSKERLAKLLMDELLERLSSRESLLKIFGEMTSLPIDDVIERLLTDFERTVEEYLKKRSPGTKQVAERRAKQSTSESTISAEPEVHLPRLIPSAVAERIATKPKVEPVKPEPSIQEPPKREQAKPEPVKRPAPAPVSLQFDPIKLDFPKIKLKIQETKTVSSPPEERQQEKEVPVARKERSPQPEVVEPDEELRKLESFARKIESEYAAKAKSVPSEPTRRTEELEEEHVQTIVPKIPSAVEATGFDEENEDDEIVSVDSAGSIKHTTRARYDFADDEYVYVHAVSKIPGGETPVPEPFMLEEKGIDGREFAFGHDYSGMRFYLSKVNPNELNISKAMVLLLNKQESIQLQGMHESTLNDLRAHGILLPMDFGTVVRGKDSFFNIVDKNLDDLEDALADIENTTKWTVTASVLDSTIAQIVGTEVQTVGRDRSRDRASYTSSPQGKKFDIKVLERILQREKKLAEGVHAELSAVAGRSNVEMMVGLGSGSSEDWKVILKGAYDVLKKDVMKFNRTVTDLQYHHLQYDLMLAVTGKPDCITLRRK
ncbi:MAG: hypothetical protein HW412_1020 [Bacteroidetes bacterium]|nr:hypothetical protein [Bacteroidota bacterium]